MGWNRQNSKFWWVKLLPPGTWRPMPERISSTSVPRRKGVRQVCYAKCPMSTQLALFFNKDKDSETLWCVFLRWKVLIQPYWCTMLSSLHATHCGQNSVSSEFKNWLSNLFVVFFRTSSKVISYFLLSMAEVLHQLIGIVYPIICRVLYIPCGAGFLSSTVPPTIPTVFGCCRLNFGRDNRLQEIWNWTPRMLDWFLDVELPDFFASKYVNHWKQAWTMMILPKTT